MRANRSSQARAELCRDIIDQCARDKAAGRPVDEVLFEAAWAEAERLQAGLCRGMPS